MVHLASIVHFGKPPRHSDYKRRLIAGPILLIQGTASDIMLSLLHFVNTPISAVPLQILVIAIAFHTVFCRLNPSIVHFCLSHAFSAILHVVFERYVQWLIIKYRQGRDASKHCI